LDLVLGIGEEADARGIGHVERCNALDARFGRTKQIAAQGGDQLSKRGGCRLHGTRLTSAR
jgi:hypothetical protein